MGYESWRQPTLLDVLVDLRRDLGVLSFPFPAPGADTAEHSRTQLIAQLDDGLIPRLRELSIPAIVLLFGSTGAGKSTLVNSLASKQVSQVGVLRPTTRTLVGIGHPSDIDLLKDHPLSKITKIIPLETVPRGMILLDAPDFDSIQESNHELTIRLTRVADLMLYVTTASRYADSLAWDYLIRAARRRTAMAIVLNRVPAGALEEVRGDLVDKLTEKNLGEVPLFTIEQLDDPVSILPETATTELVEWLDMVAGPGHSRGVIITALASSLDDVLEQTQQLHKSFTEQIKAIDALDFTYEAAVGEIAAVCAQFDNKMTKASQELDTLWQTLTGSRSGLSDLVGSKGRIRGGKRRARKRELDLGRLDDAVNQAAASLFTQAGNEARARMREAWDSKAAPQGTAYLLTRHEGDDQATADQAAASKAVEEGQAAAARWRESLMEYVDGPEAGLAFGAMRQIIGRDGLSALTGAAALGCEGAMNPFIRFAPHDADRAVIAAQKTLRQEAMTAALASLSSFAEIIREVRVDNLAGARIELRLAELRRLTE